MKKLLLPFLLGFVLMSCQQNKTNPPINKIYFLVGTLNDYMGREKYKEINNRVDRYYQSEKPLSSRIYSMFRKSYPDLKLRIRKLEQPKRNIYELYSKSLANKIDDYYSYKPSGQMTYSGKADFKTLNLDSLTKTKDFYTTKFDTIYTGRVKHDLFKNKSQKLSFISGIYLRYGQNTDSTYTIKMYNSVSKAGICVQLLKEIGCKNVEYEVLKNIPVNNIIHFTPTNELKNYFKALNFTQ